MNEYASILISHNNNNNNKLHPYTIALEFKFLVSCKLESVQTHRTLVCNSCSDAFIGSGDKENFCVIRRMRICQQKESYRLS